MRTKLRFLSRVIYKLKRSYGLPIDYYQSVARSNDLESGDASTSYFVTHISKAIVLRAREYRSFVYDLSYISANKDFTEGGFFDPQDRRVIIDAKDVALDFNPVVEDYFIYDGEKYEVKEVFDYGQDATYTMLARKLRGALKIQIENTISVLKLEQNVTSEKADVLLREVTSVLTLSQVLNEVP